MNKDIHDYQGRSEEERGRTGRETANRKVTSGGAGKDVKDNKGGYPGTIATPVGPMRGELMNFTQMLESLRIVYENIDAITSDPMNDIAESSFDNMELAASSGGIGGTNDEELLEALNQLFTPILVMQGFEEDVADRIQEACSEANVLMERNIIKFDDSTRMAQLTSVCALLLARQKNSPQYQMYKKAAQIRNATKLDIQKQEHAAARALAQKYLVKVSTTNNSSVARRSAQNLLPQTQH